MLLIGAGGSARSVAHAFARAGVARLTVANRTPARARALVASLRHRGSRAADLGALADRALLADLDLIVNSTSTGLGSRHAAAHRFATTPRRLLCCDLMYGAKPSRFLRSGERGGPPHMDGSGMLLHQGALAFTLWTGGRRRSR